MIIRYFILLTLIFLPISSEATLNIQKSEEGSGVRAVHFVLRMVAVDDALLLIDKASASGFNAVQVVLTDGVALDHSLWKPRIDAWSQREFIAWALYAKSKGMQVIPEIKLLTHQEKSFQNQFPHLMYNTVSYNSNNSEVYEKVFLFLDHIIKLLNPKIIHIGHDEVVGWNNKHAKKILKKGDPILPSDLFVKDVLKIHAFLKKYDIETWIWGDMLITPWEFPGMLAKHLHGSLKEYGKAVRDKLPKDIVICDWHYFDDQADFPSLAVMQGEGFRVIGATWKKEKTIQNFSRYAKKHGAYGMMATTWWHVQKKEWEKVNRIIDFSGKVFLKDFPDGK